MLEQYGHVVALDNDTHVAANTVWVNIRKGDTACDSGCSQGVACCQNSYFGKRETQKLLAVHNSQQLPLSIGTRVMIGIPERGVLVGAVMAYLVPLLAMLAALIMGHQFFGAHDGALALSALAGLGLSMLGVRFWSRRQVNNPRYHAQLLKCIDANESDTQTITLRESSATVR